MLFNTALENVIRGPRINITGTIFNNSVQILAYADYIDIFARSKETLTDAFILSMKKAAYEIGLKINSLKSNTFLEFVFRIHTFIYLKLVRL